MLPRLVIVVLLAVLPAAAQLRSSTASVVMRAEMPQTLGITLTHDAGSLKADATWRLNPAIASQIQLQASLNAARSSVAPRFVLASFHAEAEAAASSIWVLRQAISPATAAEQRRIFALPDSSPGTPAKGILRLSVDAY